MTKKTQKREKNDSLIALSAGVREYAALVALRKLNNSRMERERVELSNLIASVKKSAPTTISDDQRGAVYDSFRSLINFTPTRFEKWKRDPRIVDYRRNRTTQAVAKTKMRLERIQRMRGRGAWSSEDYAYAWRVVRFVEQVTAMKITYLKWVVLNANGHDWQLYHSKKLPTLVRLESKIAYADAKYGRIIDYAAIVK